VSLAARLQSLGEAAATPLTRYAVLVPAAIALVVFPLVSDDLYYQNMLILTFLLAIMSSSWNIISGYAGYISLGQSAFLGFGGYVAALLAIKLEISPFWFVPVSAIAAGALAAIVGAVLTRTRGHSFVILTIAFLLFLQLIVLNFSSLTNGSHGLTLPLPAWSREFQNWPFYYAMLALLGLTIWLSRGIRRTKFGLGLIAIREDEERAASVGIKTSTYKVLSFVASAIFIGAAGAIYAYYLTFIEPVAMFDIIISVQIVLAALLGGRGTLWGPVLGAFILEPLNEYTNQSLQSANLRLIVFGGLLVIIVLLLPQGIVPSLTTLLTRRRSIGFDPPNRPAKEGGATAAGPLSRKQTDVPTAPATPTRPLLQVKDLEKRFGGVVALQACSLKVDEGSITALIGPNGSGKTTLFNVIDGTMKADKGEVWFDGRRIQRDPSWNRAHRGLGRTFQIPRLFPQMTVLENVVAPMSSFSWAQLKEDAVSGPEVQRAENLLEFVNMQHSIPKKAGSLSYGQQKLVELAQTLMLDPSLIMLDEPTGGVNPRLIKDIMGIIRTLNQQGMTFLIVEHNMPFVLGLCDPVIVLAQGTGISRGAPRDIQSDKRVLEAYLGDDLLDQPQTPRV
jgi:ABC-type branched-subunit amino acid transport system ATPase component/ABC-type branched-subunit amino acid transport system permease subunit